MLGFRVTSNRGKRRKRLYLGNSMHPAQLSPIRSQCNFLEPQSRNLPPKTGHLATLLGFGPAFFLLSSVDVLKITGVDFDLE
jgi:hypothetical protein